MVLLVTGPSLDSSLYQTKALGPPRHALVAITCGFCACASICSSSTPLGCSPRLHREGSHVGKPSAIAHGRPTSQILLERVSHHVRATCLFVCFPNCMVTCNGRKVLFSLNSQRRALALGWAVCSLLALLPPLVVHHYVIRCPCLLFLGRFSQGEALRRIRGSEEGEISALLPSPPPLPPV